MIIDTFSQFSVAQAVSGTDVPSTEMVDAGEGGRLLGPGKPMFVVVHPATVATTTTVEIVTDDDPAFGSPETIGSVTVPAGARGVYAVGFPYTNKRYIRLHYSGEGTFTSHLTDQVPPAWRAYASPSQQ